MATLKLCARHQSPLLLSLVGVPFCPACRANAAKEAREQSRRIWQQHARQMQFDPVAVAPPPPR